MKLLELCSHIGIGNHAYEDILPRWSDFSSDFPSYASSLPSIKLSIEAMVCARNNYYKSKLEKLDIVFTALEIRYQQVLHRESLLCRNCLSCFLLFILTNGKLRTVFSQWGEIRTLFHKVCMQSSIHSQTLDEITYHL